MIHYFKGFVLCVVCLIILLGVMSPGVKSVIRVPRQAPGETKTTKRPDDLVELTTPAPTFEGFSYLTSHLSSVYYVSDNLLSKEEATTACRNLGTNLLPVELAGLYGGDYGLITNALGSMGVDDLYINGIFAEQNGKKVIIYEGLYGRQVHEVEGDQTIKSRKKRSADDTLITYIERRVRRAADPAKQKINTPITRVSDLESKTSYVTVIDTQYPWLANWTSTAPGCADSQCSPTVCSVTTKPCVAGHEHSCLLAVTQPECHVQDGGGNCTQTCDDCKIGKSVCTIEQPQCPGKLNRTCFVVDPVCEIETPQCTVTRPPCVSRQPPCNITQDSPAKVVCPPMEVFCAPEIISCPTPKLNCIEACVYCKDLASMCSEAKVNCTNPRVTCKSVSVSCPAVLTHCPNPIVDCPPPKFFCKKPQITCKKPDNPCPISTTPDAKPCPQECKGDCKCVKVKRQANGEFKQEPVPCETKLKFICEGAKTKGQGTNLISLPSVSAPAKPVVSKKSG